MESVIEKPKNKAGRPKGSKDKVKRKPGAGRLRGTGEYKLTHASSLAAERLKKQIIAEQKKFNKSLQIKADYADTHKWEHFKPFKWQNWLSDYIRKNNIVLAVAPNGIGKSCVAMCILCSWVEGYEAWSPVEADWPGAVKVNGSYFKGSSLGIAPPVDIRVTGEDWDHHLKRVVVKAMLEWFPCENYHVKRNSTGVEYFWTHKKNGSTIELMTHGMEVKLFEGWRGHGWIPDEPPKEPIFNAMTRGLAEKKGKVLIPSTPLREAWMLDKLVLRHRSDTKIMDSLLLYDNEVSYGSDNAILEELGIQGKVTKYYREADGHKKHFFDLILEVDDFGKEAEEYLRANCTYDGDLDKKINDMVFLRKAKDTTLEEKPSRFFGFFKKLVGLVVKEYDRSVHIVPVGDGKIPTNWIVSFQIDFHLSKPQAIAFYACSERNIHYCIHEVWENMSASEIADLIIRKKKIEGWNITYGEIDPLSKGDDKYIKNRDAEAIDSFTILKDLLGNEGIELGVASKDKKSGFSNIKSWLKGPNKIPVLYYLDSLGSVANDDYGVIYEIQRLCYDDKGVIEKVDDHFMECLYRYTNMGIEYSEPRPKILQRSNGSSGGWMGS